MHLEANFDIEQVGGTLEWSFIRKDHNGDPIKGKYAGGIYYTIGESMQIRVKAGSWKQMTSFKVLDCTLITRPQIVDIAPKKKAKFAPPSPFITTTTPPINITGASINLAGDDFKFDGASPALPGGYSDIALLWDKHLTVGEMEGRWEISFVLTVEVAHDDGPPFQRVLCFDPEGEVGTTVTPPR